MLRQDYLLREIERVMEFILRALGMKQTGDPDDFIRFLRENSLTLTGLPYETLLTTPAAKLVALFYNEDGRGIGRLVASGALLAEAGELHRKDDDLTRARDLFIRATEILAFATSRFGGDAGAQLARHLATQREHLPLYDFPPEATARLELLCNTAPPAADQI